MISKEQERQFLSLLGEQLVSLPFDLKILQEAVTSDDLERQAREIAAGTIVHTIQAQEGDSLLKYTDDVMIVRAAMQAVVQHGGEGAAAFRKRFDEIYGSLDEALTVFSTTLGAERWEWLTGKLETFPRLSYKGRRASQYVDDDESQSALFDEGLEFETNYTVSEEQVRNRLRRLDQVTELLDRKRAEEAKKKA